MHLVLPRPSAIALTVLALVGLCAAPTLRADAGHDHGDAGSKVSSPGLPRFTAASDLFELVGVLNGRQLTLYLDRSADNSPVQGAKLELEIGGAGIDTRARADGEFEATLPQALKPGVTPVTATVVAGAQTDLLAGEFMIPDELRAEAPRASRWQQVAAWTAAGLLLFTALAWLGRRAWGRRVARVAGAA
jgi:hypothetical protein